ncbi:hypothetical protein QLX08_010347 [Tetragonisca angustula]|uniref:Uncharacterized protein n=1 Tax=Tetragonisca angustula TaxID=166442 RepID=A0AAW0ZFA8_9HYME
MRRTSGQELPPPFPDDASLESDKVCESAKLAVVTGNRGPPSPLPPPPRRNKKDTTDIWAAKGENFGSDPRPATLPATP